MRKTRLVILPTKCLHQMGFLLLFLSCPVIGDWGRIRPETEDSHNAIQIEREGTCGFERDPPGGLLGFLNENGSKQCRLSEESDLIKPTKTSIVETRSLERRVDVRRVDVRRVHQERNSRMSERRVDDQKIRLAAERRDTRRKSERRVQMEIRSRSVESRRPSINRNNIPARSFSLSRLENERAVRRSVPAAQKTREYNERRERLHLGRRINERENERRVDKPHLNREIENVRERRDTRLRTTETDRRDTRRENRRSNPDLSMRRRENDMTRRQSRERTQNARERTENRLSLTRRENAARSVERTETRRSINRLKLDRRLPEIRKTRSVEYLDSKSERREDAIRQQIDNRRLVPVSPKVMERNLAERRNERIEGMKSRRFATIRLDNKPELKKEKDSAEAVTTWTNLTSYENFKTGDWTTNCVIGAVVYFLTTRQVKAV